MTKYAIYARVSTTLDSQAGSYEAQVNDLKARVKVLHPDYQLVNIYGDYGISGTKEERPVFKEMIDDAIVKTDIENADEVSRKAQAEILRLADEQRESKFAQEMERVISEEFEKAKTEEDAEVKPEDIDFEQLESKVEETAENLIEMLAVEKAEDKEKYVQMVLDQLDSSALTEEQKSEIKAKVDAKVAETLDRNYRNRDENRVNRFEAAAAFAKSENRFVQDELAKLDDSAVLSKEVREAIDNIKANVKHEKTKKGSIGTITDLDRRLRHMRDIL